MSPKPLHTGLISDRNQQFPISYFGPNCRFPFKDTVGCCIASAQGGGGGTWVQFLLGMCRWPFRTPFQYPIIVYSVDNYRPHLSHFWPRIFLFLNPCLPEFSYPRNPENVQPHSSNSTKLQPHFSQSSGTSPLPIY